MAESICDAWERAPLLLSDSELEDKRQRHGNGQSESDNVRVRVRASTGSMSMACGRHALSAMLIARNCS